MHAAYSQQFGYLGLRERVKAIFQYVHENQLFVTNGRSNFRSKKKFILSSRCPQKIFSPTWRKLFSGEGPFYLL
jgi:hypothetical protein